LFENVLSGGEGVLGSVLLAAASGLTSVVSDKIQYQIAKNGFLDCLLGFGWSLSSFWDVGLG